MKAPNVELENTIRQKALELLMEKEPEEIGMREIARACGVTPPTIYYYFRDKDQLFARVKQDCLAVLDETMENAIENGGTPVHSIRSGFTAFRDWAFENQRVAILIMGRFKADIDDIESMLRRNYRSFSLAVELVEKSVLSGHLSCADPVLAVSLCVYSLWGVVESVLSKRTHPRFWDRGLELTDASIQMCMDYLGWKGDSV